MRYTGAALKTAVDLSARYINDRKLPDKAIDVIDEAAAAQNLLPPITRAPNNWPERNRSYVATMARIPSKHVSRDDKAVLAILETDLKRMVFGQDPAITALASAIKLSRAGLRDAGKAELVIICFPAQQALVKPRSLASLPKRLASS